LNERPLHERAENSVTRWLKISAAVKYSAMTRARLIRLAKAGKVRGYQDAGNKQAWIFDRLSIDEYHESKLPSPAIRQNVLRFFRGGA